MQLEVNVPQSRWSLRSLQGAARNMLSRKKVVVGVLGEKNECRWVRSEARAKKIASELREIYAVSEGKVLV